MGETDNGRGRVGINTNRWDVYSKSCHCPSTVLWTHYCLHLTAGEMRGGSVVAAPGHAAGAWLLWPACCVPLKSMPKP